MASRSTYLERVSSSSHVSQLVKSNHSEFKQIFSTILRHNNLSSLAKMNPETCQCSLDALQIMTELRDVHAVVDLGTILDLVHRVYRHGQTMINCHSCKMNPQSSIVTLPALAEQCLSLFDSVCSAYNIARRNSLFDPGLRFDQPLPQFICIRSKTILGQIELDDDESGLLVRTLLNRNVMRLIELLDALKGILRALSKDAGHAHRAGAATLRACESSVESIIHRLAMFMDQIAVGSSTSLT